MAKSNKPRNYKFCDNNKNLTTQPFPLHLALQIEREGVEDGWVR